MSRKNCGRESMEPISKIAKPNLGQMPVTPPSKRLSNADLQRMGTLMQNLRDYFPGQNITEGTADEYLTEWEDMVRRFGMERFELGLRIAKKWKREGGSDVPREFFPKPSEIEHYIAERTHTPLYAEVDSNCSDCGGTGFAYVGSGPGREVKRCSCRVIKAREA